MGYKIMVVRPNKDAVRIAQRLHDDREQRAKADALADAQIQLCFEQGVCPLCGEPDNTVIKYETKETLFTYMAGFSSPHLYRIECKSCMEPSAFRSHLTLIFPKEVKVVNK